MRKNYSQSKIGVVHGRFQPFHNGHLDYALTAKRKCDFLYIGIANPDPSLTQAHQANEARATPDSNPFTYFERQAMIKAALLAEGLSQDEFELVPFPINFPEYIRYYTPASATYFITIYDAWGRAKKETLELLGLHVDVLEEGGPELKLAAGTTIRKTITEQAPWEKFVPKAVSDYILENDLLQRIQTQR